MRAASLANRLRIPLPKRVLALGLSNEALEIIGNGVGRDNVALYHDPALLEAALVAVAEVSLVVRIPSDSDERMCDAIVRLRRLFPHIPMVAVFIPMASSCRAILRLGAAGVSQIVTGEPALRSADLMQALSKSHEEGVAVRLWRSCDLSLPEPLVPVLKAALRLAHSPITAEALGDSTGMHERSLRKYCSHHAFPSPQWIVGWARLLVAGFYLDEPGRTVAQVAHLLDFPSACALRNQLKRYSGLASRSLRASGTALTVARRLEGAIATHREYHAANQVKPVPQPNVHLDIVQHVRRNNAPIIVRGR